MEDKKVFDKVTEANKQIIVDECNDIIKWLDSNQLASKEEYEYKQELDGKLIIMKMYQGTGWAPGGFPDGMQGFPGRAPGAGAASPRWQSWSYH